MDGPEAWRSAEYKKDTKWIDVLSAQHVAELDAAVSGVLQRGIEEIQVSSNMRGHHLKFYVCVSNLQTWRDACGKQLIVERAPIGLMC